MATPNTFALDYDSAIESVLSDIPLFCVGLMAFGIFTFFLVMKRVTLSTTFLYSSSFFAFSGAILDLSQILARARANADLVSSSSGPSGLTPAREVCFALAVGFVYLFMWSFVAICPHAEQSYVGYDGLHSAKWERWGLLGHVLRWFSLTIVVTIPILQIAWRLSAGRRDFNPVYASEATLEIVASAVFILKLLLNVSLSPLRPISRPLRTYAIPFVSISISLGLGIGNLLLLQFSETTTGRLLQAIELYVFTLYVLISEFYNEPSQGLTAAPTEKSIVGEIRVNQSTFLDGNPYGPRSPSRTPDSRAIARVVSWVSSRRISSNFMNIDNRQKRNADLEGAIRLDSPQDVPSFPSIAQSPPNPNPVIISPRSMQPIQQRPSPPMGASRPLTQNSEGSDYSSTRPDSPVYGLDGIIAGAGESVSVTRNGSLSSFDELLRQQTELDKSIAALRLFSTAAIASEAEPQKGNLAVIIPASMASSSNLTLKGRTESTSGRSEFSLSSFPQPPPISEEETVPDSAHILGRPQPQDVPKGFSILSAATPAQPTPQGMDTGSGYDVTSFIGGLTLNPATTNISTVQSEATNSNSPSESKPSVITPLSTVRGRSRPFNTIPSRPRLQIGAPQLLPQDGTDAPPGVFEKPRTPPLRLTRGS